MASGSRFALLDPDTVLGGSAAQHHSGSTPRPSRPPSPTESSAAGSPTPSLAPAYVPPSYTWNGTEYATLEEAIQASAGNIRPEFVDWVTTVTKSFLARDLAAVYNALGDKMYEQRNTARLQINGLAQQLQATQEQNRLLQERVTQAEVGLAQEKQANDTLHKNQDVLLAAVQKLSAEVTTLRTEVTGARIAGTFANTSSAPRPSALAPSSHRPKVADPPKYKGNKSGDLTLEQWLQKMGLWFRYQNIQSDEDRITTALMYLEGGAHSFMDDYAERASIGQNLGTWEEFVKRLQTGYRQMSPEKSAQQSLDELCAKQHSSMASFAEGFRLHAVKSGYANVELIRRIDQQRSREMRMVMTTVAQIQPVETTWEKYLAWALDIKMKMREDGKKYGASSNTTRTTQKDPNAMDTSTVDRKPEKMSKEQLEWQAKGLCFRCGKHPRLAKGQRCRTPKYTGYYEFPAKVSSTTARVVDEEAEEKKDTTTMTRDDFIRAATQLFDQKSGKGKGKETKEVKEVAAARIVEVEDEADFLLSTL